MGSYSELIKNFEKTRSYMREFYVYGFKSRNEYDKKSARSYDDERRRIESWLGEHMQFVQTAEGKNVFLSIDSRSSQKNPFYQAWKVKSFTDKDITMHFLLFDILHEPNVKLTLQEIMGILDNKLQNFGEPLSMDESTVRKKLKEYASLGIIKMEKDGRRMLYSRAEDMELSDCTEALDFFSETSPCGVIGSFLQDRAPEHENIFSFKHHYMTQALDSDVMALLFTAMHEKCFITASHLGRRGRLPNTLHLVPLKIYISSQNGRQHLLAFQKDINRIYSYRLDYLSDIKIEGPCEDFDALRKKLKELEQYMWGVNCRWNTNHLEHIEFEVYVGPNEKHIIQRLEREKRTGKVEQVDENHWRYSAEVFESSELIPWIRTFICRITKLNFSNRTAENRFKKDLEEMYRLYELDGGDRA